MLAWLVLCHNLILGSVWQRGQASIAGTALRVLRTTDACPLCHTPSFGCDKALDAESIRNNSEVGIAQLNLGGCSSLRPSPSCGSSTRHGLMQVRYPSIERLESVPISEDQRRSAKISVLTVHGRDQSLVAGAPAQAPSFMGRIRGTHHLFATQRACNVGPACSTTP